MMMDTINEEEKQFLKTLFCGKCLWEKYSWLKKSSLLLSILMLLVQYSK